MNAKIWSHLPIEKWPYYWWKVKLGPRRYMPCKVTARGSLGTVRVEFADGFEVTTGRHAVRKRK